MGPPLKAAENGIVSPSDAARAGTLQWGRR